MRVTEQRNGLDDVRAAVHELDEAEYELEELRDRLQAELAKAQARVDQARARLQDVVASGRCTDDCPPPSGGSRGLVSLDDATVPICWRIAFSLLSNPVLDYQGTAERLWGKAEPGLHKEIAKNRVNAQLTRLKKLSVIQALGSNRYQVNAQRLAELSGLPIPGKAAP